MNEIYILFLILGTLFVIENKSINLLAYYVGMVIIIAILIAIYPNLNNIEQYWNGISYISYILVLVQISALTILFGFIIMLYPKNNTDILIKQKNLNTNILSKGMYKIKFLKTYIFIILTIISIIIFLQQESLNEFFNNLGIFELINNLKTGNKLEITNMNDISNVNNNTSLFLNKISYLLYTEPSNILKFMVLTIILLFAIICLFFILNPTM